MPTKADAPPLKGWITLIELAERLRITRQAVHQHAENGRIQTLHRVGHERPVWVMRESEIPELRRRLDQARPGPARYHSHDDEEGAEHAAAGQRAGDRTDGAAVPAAAPGSVLVGNHGSGVAGPGADRLPGPAAESAARGAGPAARGAGAAAALG